MRVALIALSSVALIGCYGESTRPPDYPREEAGDEGTEVVINPEVYDNPQTAELGTDRTRGIAKTIEWTGISTEVGATYHEDALTVDHIFRDDADNQYGVRVRLKNSTKNVVKGEYLIRFYTRQGGQILGYKGVGGQQERWTGIVVDPFGVAVADDFARVSGAEGFRFFLRKGGSKDEGLPDDPAKKEERRAAREQAGRK
ncbi:MAG TPA: hypothetical protein VF950_30505 [Planctomycetota bacterium]